MPKAKKSVKKTAKKAKSTKKPVASKTKKVMKKTAARKPVKKAKKKVSFLPKGYSCITPYLIVNNAKEAIRFYTRIFGAKETLRMEHNGKIGHVELKIGDTKIMLADECPEMDARSPQAIGGTPVSIHLYVKNVDDVVKHAASAGATVLRAPQDMFYGDRAASLQDPFGHKWHVATHIEDLTPAQVRKRAAAVFG